MRYLIAVGIYPPEIGGPSTVIQELVKQLKERGEQVTVVTYGEAREVSEVMNVPRTGGVVARYSRFFLTVRKLLTPDTLVLATDVFSVGIPVRLALVGKSNKMMLRLGGEWFWEDSVEKGRIFVPLKDFWRNDRGSWRRRFAKLNYGWQLKRAGKIAVTSELLGGVLQSICPQAAGKIQTVSNFVKPQACAAEAVTRPHTPLRLLYVGRFARVKNVPFLARTIKVLADGGNEVACTLAGDGPTIAETRKILGQVRHTIFLGNVAHEKIAELLGENDLLVLPSLTDICPNIVLEALACGVPVLMTKEHGLSPGLGGVIELPPTDQAAWMAAIRRISESDEYGRLRAQISLPDKPQLDLSELLTAL